MNPTIVLIHHGARIIEEHSDIFRKRSSLGNHDWLWRVEDIRIGQRFDGGTEIGPWSNVAPFRFFLGRSRITQQAPDLRRTALPAIFQFESRLYESAGTGYDGCGR